MSSTIFPEEVLRHATTFYQAGRLAEAEELCLVILSTEPKHAAANYYLGLISMQQGQAELALMYAQVAWEVDPSEGQHWLALAECLLALGRFEDALNLVKQAIKRGLDMPQAKQLKLIAKRGLDRAAPSTAVVEEMLALFRVGRNAELERRVLPLLEQYPGWVFGWRALGAAMGILGRDAEPVLRRAMELSPQDASTHNNLGVVLRERGRMEESLTCLRKALQLSPKYAEAHYNLGAVFQDLSRYDEAIVCFRKAIGIKPDYFEAQAELSNSLAALGRFPEALEILNGLPKSRPEHAKALSNLLFNLTHRGDIDADTLFAEHCRFGAQFEVPSQAFANEREPERRLRVGIVSGDLYLHAVANFIEPVLTHLAHSMQLSLHAYYNHVLEDDVTQRLKGSFAQWVPVFGMTDEELAHQIRADGIDILIDLSGHTARNRLPMFARKPAPLQASWIGYAGTTGLQAMDYYLGDRFFLPPGMFDHQFTEKIARLPANAPFLPVADSPDVNTLPALEKGYVTFGSFNRPNKISRPVVALWSRLLHALPDSMLLLGGLPKGGVNDQLIVWFAQEGIVQERLILHPRSGMDVYLALHQQVDICLDTFPYNGGTTTCHAAWMGVPTLSLAGDTVTGRVGATILNHLGLSEFVAQTPEDFVQKGVYWAEHLTELAELRAGMRSRFAQSALGRPELIAAGLERALRTMWRRWCAGLPAESFEVETAISPAEVLRHAAAFYQAGRLADAEELCLSILQTEHGHADANYNLGLMALQQGQAERALPYLQTAWEGAPSEGQYWLTLTDCLLALARFEDALSLIEEAIRRGMDTPQAQQLKLLARRGKEGAAPDIVVVEKMQALFETGCYAELDQRMQPLLQEYPGWAFGWKLAGAAVVLAGKDAEAVVRRAVKLAPDDAETHSNLGGYLRDRGRKDEALPSLRRAIQLRPELVEAHFNLGATLQDLSQYDEAILCHRKALEIRPDYVEAQASLGIVLAAQGKVSVALEVLRQVLNVNPNHAIAHNFLLLSLVHSGDADAEEIFAEHCRFGEQFEAPLRAAWPAFANSREPERCLRVGIVSGDLHSHAVANFLMPVLAHLAPHVPLHAYYNHVHEDDVTQRLKGYFTQWDVVVGLSDEALAQKIRADGIDILIDLSGHTGRNRLLTFARRAAPIQASWIGYPGTTGLQAMDYYLGDRFWLPQGQFDHQFTEKLVRLPANAPFLPAGGAPNVNALPALEHGYVTFGSFNRPNKISPSVVALWARLLHVLPDSRMLLGGMPVDEEYGELIAWFAQEGIASDRLGFYPQSGMDVYLALHHQVDICLDTFPYNGGTTTCHAAWMGVPTLSLAGETVTGRVGAMILGHLGLDEFVAQDSDDFVQKGVYWAEHLTELAELRAGMRSRFAQSALGRPELIAAGLEQALHTMWRRWCAGLPAESFEVETAISPAELLRHAAAFYQAGRLAEAEELCLSILQTEPGHADANYNLGLMALQQGQAERAVPYLQTAWEGAPSEGQYWLTLTECLLALGRFEDALGLVEEAIRHGLDAPQAQQLKFRAERGRDRATPPIAAVNEAVALFETGRYLELEQQVWPLLEQYPGWAFGWKAAGAVMGALGKNAESSLRRAVELAPQDAEAHKNLGFVLMEMGRIGEAMLSYRSSLELRPDDAVTYSDLLFCLSHDDKGGANTLLSEHQSFSERFEMPLRKEWGKYVNTPDAERCMRVGIVSADLCNHAVANFIEPVLRCLVNNPNVILHAYSNRVMEDDVTRRLKGSFAKWSLVSGMTDAALAQKIRADGIDILIDLSGHTASNRLLTFARKPAPIQVSWIGYPCTTGLQAMDYYLADRFWLPPGQFDYQFTEKIVRLPANAPFVPSDDALSTSALPALESGHVTFGSFNRSTKISQPVVALWSRLLNALPDSRMLLGGMPKDGTNDQLIAWFMQEGVSRDRLTFHPKSSMDVYLALHHRVDICLDTFPYNGGTTTCHAAWMGVPTLTLAGDTITGRVGAMILGHLRLDEFVAHDPDDFVQKGVYWASRLTELAELRAVMRSRFAQSALGRPELIAAGLEQALRTMWRRWCAGQPAESFEVEPAIIPAEVLRHAAEFYQAGRLAEAEELCLSILQNEPKHADANYNLGLMALQQGRAKRALPYLQTAWEGALWESQYWLMLAECLLALARFEDALGLIEEAIRRGMDTPQAQRLKLLAQRGKETAEPDMAVAQSMQVLFETGRYAEMEQQARSLLDQYPDWALGWKALGVALQSQNKDAESVLCRAVEIAPHDAEAHNNLGVYLRKRGRPAEAVESLQAAIQIQPTFAEAHLRLGAALTDLREFDKALVSLQCAAKLRDGYAEAYQGMGAVLNGLGRFEEAVASYRRALEIKPDYVDARVNMGSALLGQGKIAEAKTCYRQVLDLMPGSAELYSNYLFCLSHDDEGGSEVIAAEHHLFGERFEESLRKDWGGYVNVPDPERRLQVGFVSADLFNHAVAGFIEPILSHLAHSSSLALHAYSNSAMDDEVTNRLKRYFARWDVVVGMSDEVLAKKIRADGVDILIDLSGHTAHNRLPMFARKPAPIQASWMGYPGTTGLQAMDYYFGDRFFLPPGQFDHQFTEKIVRLPANAPFLPASGAPDVNALPALENGYVTFGSFNRPSKLSHSVIALWSRLLHALPDSRILLGAMSRDGEYGELLNWFAQEGIARERLSFYSQSGMDVYLGLHHQVDICLDTFPYNGGTTTCHALWMGVPTLTLAGKTVAGRVGATILNHLGLDEFVAQEPDDFVQKGVYWASHLTGLADLRAGMRTRFEQSALGRSELIAAGLEQALRIMWRRRCTGLPAESFDVQGGDITMREVG